MERDRCQGIVAEIKTLERADEGRHNAIHVAAAPRELTH